MGEADAIFGAVCEGMQGTDRMGCLSGALWEDVGLLVEYMGVWGVRMYDRKYGSCPTVDVDVRRLELGDEVPASGLLTGGTTHCGSCRKAF